LTRGTGTLWTIAVLTLASCSEAPPPRLAVTASAATVLGPEPGFDPAMPPPEWFAGPGAAQAFAVVERDGITVLELRSAETVLGRRLAAPLLANPYLRWGWRLEPPVPGAGIRLVVGLAQGAERAAAPSRPGQPPPHDRRIELALVGTAAGVSIVGSPGSGQGVLLRAVDAATAQTWMVEAIDLGALHARLHPEDAQAAMIVTFVAVGGIGRRGDGRPLGQVAEIVLSR
jgi:hypothetical protein